MVRPTCPDTFAKCLRSRPVHTTGLKYSLRVPRLEHVLARYARCGLDRGTLNLSLLADASTPAAVLASMRADVSVVFRPYSL